jgi:serine/threonine-protein kinase
MVPTRPATPSAGASLRPSPLSPSPAIHPQDALHGTPYRLLRRLGEGAYGIVVEAEQVTLRRTVVIKLLRRAFSDREDLVDRLRLEAQAIAALAPVTQHVVSVLDFGRTPEGRPYIVMERLEGRSLKEELAEHGALPPARAVELALQMLDGLAAAHDTGILHRDVKPDNVFLARSRHGAPIVKLIDFGLAKLVGLPREHGGPAPLAKPTDEGMMLGTPRYFAPEQARGEPATTSSDLYSAGVVLYKALAGRDPFGHCTNVYDLVKAHLTETPAAPSLVSPHAIPPALDAVVLKALAKRPDQRHADARAFRAALHAAWHGTPLWQGAAADVASPSPKPRARRAHPAVTVPAAHLLLAERRTPPAVTSTPPPPMPRSRSVGAALAMVLMGGAAAWFTLRGHAPLAMSAAAAPAPSAVVGDRESAVAVPPAAASGPMLPSAVATVSAGSATSTPARSKAPGRVEARASNPAGDAAAALVPTPPGRGKLP